MSFKQGLEKTAILGAVAKGIGSILAKGVGVAGRGVGAVVAKRGAIQTGMDAAQGVSDMSSFNRKFQDAVQR